MSLVTILVVVVLLVLAMWAIYYIPLPPGSPAFIKPMLYVIVLIVAIIFLLMKSGLAQQPKPVPNLKASKPAAAAPATTPRKVATSKGFSGATRCEQIGRRVLCNNGYETMVR